MTPKIASEIKTVIFDLGGVLFDIDYKLTQEAFQKLGITADFQAVFSQQKQAGIFDEFEKGLISPAQFREGLRKWLSETVTDDQIDEAWNAILVGFRVKEIALLDKLKHKYDIFLLSNTNEIHLVEIMKMIKVHSSGSMDKIFIKAYYSCRMGLRKPDKTIYEQVIRENNLNPATTLFIDDLLQNIEGAQSAGLQTLHCTSLVDLESYFGEL